MARNLVIDADGHCNEPDNDLAKWMPKELAHLAPNRVTDSSGLFAPDDRRPAGGAAPLGRWRGPRRGVCAAYRTQPPGHDRLS